MAIRERRPRSAPTGRADTVVATWAPYLGFWESIVNGARYFLGCQKNVEVLVANPSARVVRVGLAKNDDRLLFLELNYRDVLRRASHTVEERLVSMP